MNNTFELFDVSGRLSFLFSACQVVGCLLLFCSWSFSTLLLAFSFAGGDVGDNGDDSDNGGGDFDNHDGDDSDSGGGVIDNHDVMCFTGLTTGMPLLPSYSLLSEVSIINITIFSLVPLLTCNTSRSPSSD